MRAKICGINSVENMETCLKAGASAFGFLVGITHKAEDKVTNDEAKEMIAKLPPFVSSVAVTHLTDPQAIIDLVQYIGASTVQIHDYIPPEEVKIVKDALQQVKVIKAVHVLDAEVAMDQAKAFAQYADAILLDSRTKDRLGGTGMTHDWDISKKIVEAIDVPVILAGGLTPDNVFEAVKKVKPFAIDVNSGVETNGNKDFHKVKAFIEKGTKASMQA